MVVTHGDTDHWKGLERLMNFDNRRPRRRCGVLGRWLRPGLQRTDGFRSSGYLDFFKAFRGVSGVQIRRPLEMSHPPADVRHASFTLPSIPGVTFTVLHSAAHVDNTECSYHHH